MVQLFRDQCRDARQESPTWGIAALWLRTLTDLASTSLAERLAALKQRKNMNDKLASLLAFHVSPASTFFRVFILVFLLVFGASVVITFILPESYASTARIKVENPAANSAATVGAAAYAPYDPYFIQTTFEIIQSELVLDRVNNELQLNHKWAKKYGKPEALSSTEVRELLRRCLMLSPVKNTQLIAITAYSDDRNEAAQIANAVANSYRGYRLDTPQRLDLQTLKGLEDESQAQKNQIPSLQGTVADLKAKYGIVEDDAALDDEVLTTEKSIRAKTAELDRLRPLTGEQKRQALPAIITDAALNELVGKLDEARQKYVMLTNNFAQTTPDVGHVTSLINELNSSIDRRVDGIMEALEAQQAADEATATALAKKIRLTKPLPETQPYWDAKQKLDTLNDAHKLLAARLENLKLDMQMPRPDPAQITDTAEPGLAPVKPNKPLNIVIGAGLGAILGAIAGVLALPLAFHKRPVKPALAA